MNRKISALVLCLCTLLTLAVPRGEVRAECADDAHDWDTYYNIDYSATNPSGTYAKCTRRCKNCTKTDTITGVVTAQQTKDADCVNSGRTTLTVTWNATWGTKNGKSWPIENYTTIRAIPQAKGHSWGEVTYTWVDHITDDYVDDLKQYEEEVADREAYLEKFVQKYGSEAASEIPTVEKAAPTSYIRYRASRTCTVCHKTETDYATITMEDLVEPTCLTTGSVTIYADENGFDEDWSKPQTPQVKEKKIESIPALGHCFLTYKRDANGTTETATCARAGCSVTDTRTVGADPSPFIQPDAYPEDAEESAGTEETAETETAEAVTAPKTGEGAGVYAVMLLAGAGLSVALSRRRKSRA